jgi:hypothetical protein
VQAAINKKSVVAARPRFRPPAARPWCTKSPRQPPLPALGADVEGVGGGQQNTLGNLGLLGGGLDERAGLGTVAELLAQERPRPFRFTWPRRTLLRAWSSPVFRCSTGDNPQLTTDFRPDRRAPESAATARLPKVLTLRNHRAARPHANIDIAVTRAAKSGDGRSGGRPSASKLPRPRALPRPAQRPPPRHIQTGESRLACLDASSARTA